MRSLLAGAGLSLICAASPLAQASHDLTLAAALDEAVARHPAFDALRLEHAADLGDSNEPEPALLLRAAVLLADVRLAFTELLVARAGLARHDEQTPMLLGMADLTALGTPPAAMGMDGVGGRRRTAAAVAAAGVTWRERVRLGEIRLNAALGRPPDAAVGPLVAPDLVDTDDPERIALQRDPDLAAADRALARADVPPAQRALAGAERARAELTVRSRVHAALVRIAAARERLALASTTGVPQQQAAYEAAQLAYASGRGTFAAMVDRHHALLDARLDLDEASADLARARVALAIAIGEPADRLSRALQGAGAH